MWHLRFTAPWMAFVASSSALACGGVTLETSSSAAGSTGTSGGNGGATSQGGSGQGGSSSSEGGGGLTTSSTTSTSTSMSTSTSGPCGCSADLQDVVDCDGAVLETCGPDKACAGGQCVDSPCAAAALAQGSNGCDFWALETAFIAEAAGACQAVAVSNTWPSPVHIQVSRDGIDLDVAMFAAVVQDDAGTTQYTLYDANTGLLPGKTALLFLSGNSGKLSPCPVPPALGSDSGFEGTGRGRAFHLTTDRPVAASQIQSYWAGDGTSSTTLLLPESSWGQDYRAINAYPKGVTGGSPSLDILAREDATQVSIVPKVPILSGPDVEPAGAGSAKTYLLNRGEYLQITQTDELSGSAIHADKPVAVFGASSCMTVPVGTAGCDAAGQQLPAVRAMGSEYAGVRYSSRKPGEDEPTRWRLVGAAPGTLLTWEPSVPSGAPQALTGGEVVELQTAGPFVVRSQDADHPFYLGAYMTGGEDYGKGDPEWVNVVPTAHYRTSYTFFANPTFADTELVIVRAPDAKGTFADVELPCAGKLAGWVPVGKYEMTRQPLMKGGQKAGPCGAGHHTITSPLPFSVTVWGIGSGFQASSSAFPAGMSLAPLNAGLFPD